MRISGIETTKTGDGFRVAARIEGEFGLDGVLWYEVVGDVVLPTPEMVASAFAAACLPVAVWWEADLHVDEPLDADFLFRLPRLARGHARMHRRKRTTQIHATGVTSEYPADRVVGMSFTGGVDSFYTLRDNLAPKGVTPVRALVTGLGLDTLPDDLASHAALLEDLGAVSSELGLDHYAIRTNFREFFDPYADPCLVSQGACLVAFAFLLSGNLATYLIPASAPIDRLYPYSSHALLDGAWISRATMTVCDGWDIHRNDKLASLIDWPLAMRHLRVCTIKRVAGNCGCCEKCLRTMALLALHGLRAPSAFPHRLEYEHVANLRIWVPTRLYWWERIREAAQSEPELAWLARASGRMLRRMRLLIPLRRGRLHRKTRRQWPLRRFD